MSSIQYINPKADVARSHYALQINISAARGLQDVLATNLGPRGTMKMLVSGAGEIKITKDGDILLSEMQIQHPTASLIARVASAQNDILGDGTTSIVLLIGELLKQADNYISEGLHPRMVAQGFEIAKNQALKILDEIKRPMLSIDRETLLCIASTSLKTKVHKNIAKLLTEVVVDAVLAIKPKDSNEVDLHMIEITEMVHRSTEETRLVRGIVCDHGARHPAMPKELKDAFILTCNFSLEYEKSEVNSGAFYKTAEERECMVAAERRFTDDRVRKIIELKKKVCGDTDRGFVVINQKGIDPISLDMLAKENILALRRAKRRNMERLVLACGGSAMNSLDELTPECLGRAGRVYEISIGEEKFTFIEDTPYTESVTILIRGPNKHSMTQIRDTVKDGIRAVKNALTDNCLVPGGGAFEIAAHSKLMDFKKTVSGKEQLGVQAFADALLVIPRILSKNAGIDSLEAIVNAIAEFNKNGLPVGIDLSTGKPMDPVVHGIYDNYSVKHQMLNSCTSIASNLLLVDEIMKAGISTTKGQGPVQ